MWRQGLAFLARHRRALLIAIALYLAAMGLLLALSSGPRDEPFQYRIH